MSQIRKFTFLFPLTVHVQFVWTEYFLAFMRKACIVRVRVFEGESAGILKQSVFWVFKLTQKISWPCSGLINLSYLRQN